MWIYSSGVNFRTIISANTSAIMRHATSSPSSPEAEPLPGQQLFQLLPVPQNDEPWLGQHSRQEMIFVPLLVELCG
jgi:hypothetical protein